jgi:hypothetical protein
LPSLAGLTLAALRRNPHAFAHWNETTLSIANAINRNEALKANAHHAVRSAGRATNRRSSAVRKTNGQERRFDSVAIARAHGHVVDCDRNHIGFRFSYPLEH